MKIKCEHEFWYAFLSAVDTLTLYPETYNIQLKNWNDWNDAEDVMFIDMVSNFMMEDNSFWNDLGLPENWSEDYLFLWIYILGKIENA